MSGDQKELQVALIASHVPAASGWGCTEVCRALYECLACLFGTPAQQRRGRHDTAQSEPVIQQPSPLP